MAHGSTLIFKTRAAVIDCLKADPALTQWVREDFMIEANSGGIAIGLGAETIASDVDPAAISPAPHSMEETFSFLVQILIDNEATIRKSEAKADEITQLVVGTLIAGKQFGLEYDGLQWAYPQQFDHVSAWTKGRGAQTLLEIRMYCKGRMTR